MKKLLLCVTFLISLGTVVRAQQDPQFTQFFNNKMFYNPGYAGTEEKICVLGSYRTQWTGFGSSTAGTSPVTSTYSINGPLGNHFGLGVNIYNDQLGFEKSLIPSFSLSYRMHFSNGGQLSPGVGIGFIQKTLAGDKYKPIDGGDALIPTLPVSANKMDVNAGLYYTQPALSVMDNFYAGFSISHGNSPKLVYTQPTGYHYEHQMKMHYYFMTGAEYRISNTLAVDPNIFVKTDAAKWSTDINAMLVYNDKFKGGLTYRTSNEIAIVLGFKFSADMQMGYSYDLTLNNIRTYSDGSHEIFLKYCFMPKMKPKPEKIPIPRLTPRFL